MTDGRNHSAGDVRAGCVPRGDVDGASVHGVKRRQLIDAVAKLTEDNRLLHQAYDTLAREHAMAWIHYNTLNGLQRRLIQWISGREVVGLVTKD